LPYNCIVPIKQVPDTKRITSNAMTEDGTVNRAELPLIFNPEDLSALELAIQIKEKFGGKVTAITMGLPSASAILRESLYRGADQAVLITDRRAAASDTLATSYIISCAIRKMDYDIVLCGRQAIDGDTAQVGPQLAEKLGITQITYVEQLISLEGKTITARRNVGNGWQEVQTELPVLMTVTGDANEPRVDAAKRMMRYKNARTPIEIEQEIRSQETEDRRHRAEDRGQTVNNRAASVSERKTEISEVQIQKLVEKKCNELEGKGLLMKQWDLDFIEADLNWCGRDGSPTKVHRIQSVVLAAKESKDIEPSAKGISDMVHELIEDKTIS
jgi:electron transfer flavoprotein beta subunit